MAFRAVTYHSLTGSMTLYGFCRYGVSSSYLPYRRFPLLTPCFAGMAFRAVTYPRNLVRINVHRFAGMAFRAVTYLVTIDRERHDVLQVWRFEQLLTGTRTRLLARRVLQVWRSSSYLPVAMEPGPCIGFCRYGVSSSYLPPTRKWVRLRCFASMAFRAVTCPFEEADSCMSSFAGISSRAATYPPVFAICLNPDFESMAFRAVTYLTEASMLGLPILQVWRFE